MYTAFGITTLYSVYNVVRYGQLPLRGLISGLMAGAGTANQGPNASTSNSCY
jgi:hypothetical protein